MTGTEQSEGVEWSRRIVASIEEARDVLRAWR
jgi:hypothetical protein